MVFKLAQFQVPRLFDHGHLVPGGCDKIGGCQTSSPPNNEYSLYSSDVYIYVCIYIYIFQDWCPLIKGVHGPNPTGGRSLASLFRFRTDAASFPVIASQEPFRAKAYFWVFMSGLQGLEFRL